MRLLSLLRQKGYMKIHASPTLEVIDGQMAKIATAKATDEENSQDGPGSDFSIRIKPNADEGRDMIVLEIDLELNCSELIGTARDDSGNELPMLSQRSVQSTVKAAVNSGMYEILSLGGVETSGENDGQLTSFLLFVKPSIVEKGGASPDEAVEEKYKYQMPIVDTSEIRTAMTVPLGKTILIYGPRVRTWGRAVIEKDKDEPTTSLLMLIKASKAEQ